MMNAKCKMPNETGQIVRVSPHQQLGTPHVACCMLHVALGMVFCCATASVSSASAEDAVPPKKSSEPSVTEQTTVKHERYLGVVTEPIPAALSAQLKELLAPGRGLLVKRVLTDSPAAKAGVQPFDVLSAADAKPLTTPDQLKELVTSQPSGRMLKLELIRGAKFQQVDVTPAERIVSRLIHRHADSEQAPGDRGTESVAARHAVNAENDQPAPLPAYAVGVQTRNGRQFQVEVRISADSADDATHKLFGTAAEITARLKPLPEAVQRSVLRQLSRISEDRKTLRTVQFRFQPRQQGTQQVLAVTLRKPEADGAIKSFEWQQPMGPTAESLPLDKMLDAPDFAAQLRDLDPAVREKIESTLKTAALPAGTLKVESSQ